MAIEKTVYRVVQEALTNILKYARASHVSLIVKRCHGEQRDVEDNGLGFDREVVAQATG